MSRKLTKMLVCACASALAAGSYGDQIFNADIGNTEKYALWPEVSLTGATWQNTDSATYNATTPALELTGEDQPLGLEFNSSVPSDGVVEFTQQAYMTPASLPLEIPANAKGGLCIVRDNENLSWYGLVKDPAASTNKWVELTGPALGLDGEGGTNVPFTVRFSTETGAQCVSYVIGSTALTSGGESALPIVVEGGFGGIQYSGEGDLRVSLASNMTFVAQLVSNNGADTNKFTTLDAAFGSDKAGEITVLAAGSFGGRDYTANDVIEKGSDPATTAPVMVDGKFYTSFADAASAARNGGKQIEWAGAEKTLTEAASQDAGNSTGVTVTASINLSDIPNDWVKEYGIEEATKGSVCRQNNTGLEIPLETSDPSYDPSGLYTVKAYCRPNTSDAGGKDELVFSSETVIGVLKAVSSAAKTIIAVPWCELGTDGDVTVANLVKTANLSKGDKIYVYNKANSRYDVWSLTEEKTWSPFAIYAITSSGISSESSGEPTATTVARGNGVWLERQDTSKPIYFYGRHSTAAVETALDAGADENTRSWNLIAAPGLTEVNLNAKFADDAYDNDRIIVPTGGAPKTYEKRNGSWGYWSTTTTEKNGKTVSIPDFRTNDSVIPRGIGAWYLNKGDSKNFQW